MAVKPRLTPTLFDKLVADVEMSGMREDDGVAPQVTRESLRFYTVPRLERFNEAALRATVRRELAWLLNTTNYGALADLDAYPQVATSVVNYGVPDLAGKISDRRMLMQRAREIRNAIRAFEPRLDPERLTVEAVEVQERHNAVTFVIQGDVTAAAQAMPVKFHTHIDAEDASVDVQE